MSKVVLCCRDLSKTYHDAGHAVAVLDKVNLTITQGEMVAIMGSSGAGKSTLLQLLGGLDRPSSGVVEVDGCDIMALSERARGQLRNRALGFVYQFHHLLPEFDALENVCMPLQIRGESPAQIRERAMYYLRRVGLVERIHHRIGELSGGERQRVAIARALVTEPQCVLADEPTGNLDSVNAQQIMQLLCQLNQEFKTSFIIVTHNYALARPLHRMLQLSHGQLQAHDEEANS